MFSGIQEIYGGASKLRRQRWILRIVHAAAALRRGRCGKKLARITGLIKQYPRGECLRMLSERSRARILVS